MPKLQGFEEVLDGYVRRLEALYPDDAITVSKYAPDGTLRTAIIVNGKVITDGHMVPSDLKKYMDGYIAGVEKESSK